MSKLISINEAVQQGIERLRLPIWAMPMDHLKIDILAMEDGNKEPRLWAHLYSPFNLGTNDKDPFPILLLTLDMDKAEWEIYTGVMPDSDEYKAEQDYYMRAMGKSANEGSKQ